MALTLGGCGLFQSGQDSPEEPPVAESPEPPEPPEDNSEEVFEEETSPPQVSATEGLIPSTPPSERRKNIQTGRDNPFSVIPIQPVIRRTSDQNGTAQNGMASNAVAANGMAPPEQLCTLEQKPVATVAQAPGTATPVSDLGPAPLLEPVLPIPNEARGVVVSGVMQLNGTPVAIVKAPNENVARQVRVGGSLSNGQVRVKAINASSQRPYVVLEQYGLEIPRGIGEPAEEPVDPPTPSAPQPVASDESSVQVPGPDGFGTVRNVTLLTLNIGEVPLGEGDSQTDVKVSGTICNKGFSPISVEEIKLQVEDKATGAILDSFEVPLGRSGTSVTMGPGQKTLFDGSIPKLRGRQRGDVNIKLMDWS
ncbi:hypothetical protein [Cyanothece sp. BG0011]|uniref:hypothetical protein n=1 Tax=Cyanothece sp. BG0011 TaxID=2082950 RepID=UPI0018E5A696|nr:hypothetical protein [Cyanothece sp. BG0011]